MRYQACGNLVFGDGDLPPFLASKSPKPFINNDLTVTSTRIEFKPLSVQTILITPLTVSGLSWPLEIHITKLKETSG